jgi:hypothetical protein
MVKAGLTSGIQDLISLALSRDGKFHALLIELKTEDEKKIGSKSRTNIFS